MRCDQAMRWIEEGGDERALSLHAATCDDCRRRLGLHEALCSLPPVSPPSDLDDRVLSTARRPFVRPLKPVLLRTAAAALALIAGLGALWIARPGDEAYRPRNLEIVDGGGRAPGDEEAFLEEVYGPDTPILTAEGGRHDASPGR